MKINFVLDSHVGEMYLISPMLYKWYLSGELKIDSEVNIYTINKKIDERIIRRELDWVGDKFLLNISEFDVINSRSGAVSKFKKALSLLFFLRSIYRTKSAVLTILPYDQKEVFYRLTLKLLSGRVVAIPHTTGPEVYNDNDMDMTKHNKSRKLLPVLTQSGKSRKYFENLGFEHQIEVGAYHALEDFSSMITASINDMPEKDSKELVLFSLGLNSDMFTFEQWVEVHKVVLDVLVEFKEVKTYIKLHPSQSKSDFLKYFSEYTDSFTLITCHPESISHRADYFISIMTSAAHHALGKNKSVANFGTASFRQAVKQFGNDPYPYKIFSVPEIETKKDLKEWVESCIKSSADKKEGLDTRGYALSLQQLCASYDKLISEA